MATFSLVHGAWHGGWAWDDVRAELKARGHVVHAPDLPCEDVDAGVEEYARLVPPADVVVGHSLGGLTIPLVPAARLVFLTAYMPQPGKALTDRDDEAWGPRFADAAVRDELGRSYWPDGDTAFARLYPDCTRAQSDAAFVRLRPQAPIEPIVRPGSEGDVVVATLRDACIAPEWQLRAGAAHAARVLTLDAGHSPFFTHPSELADLLESLL